MGDTGSFLLQWWERDRETAFTTHHDPLGASLFLTAQELQRFLYNSSVILIGDIRLEPSLGDIRKFLNIGAFRKLLTL